MELFKGKSPSERNKIIAAIVLGVLAFGALAFAFGPGLFSSRTSVAVTTASPSPSPSVAVNYTSSPVSMPSQADQNFVYVTTPVVFNGSPGGPDPGRNIFAFYEPPPPTPWVPTPAPTPPPPTPAPTPHMLIAFVQPQSVYAGQRGFRLEVNGDRFTPDAKIYFNQTLVPTTFVNLAKLTADIPANFIAGAGQVQVIVQTPDGKMYSNPGTLNVQPPPKPNLYFIGMISKKYGSNDTAYFVEQSKVNTMGTVPEIKRLNDVIGGRFRIVSISEKQVIVEDTSLGFRHQLPLYTAAGTTIGPGGRPTGPGFPVTSSPGFPSSGFSSPTSPPVVPLPGRQRPQNRNADNSDDDDDDNDDDDRPRNDAPRRP
jgi:hypothetical protein